MEENRDKWEWLKRKDHHYLLPFVIVVTLGVAVWLIFFSDKGVLAWVRSSMEEKAQLEEIGRLEAEIGQMDQEIDALRNNRDTLEKYARDTYHFAAPGDDVYIVE